MTDDEVRVWVKTSVIEELLFGKVKTSCLRRSIVEDGFNINNNAVCNWGWARAHRIRETGTTGSNSTATFKVYINDEESEYHQQTIVIPSEKASEAVVMDNVWEEDDDEEGEEKARYGRTSTSDSSGPPDDLIQLTHLHEPAVVHCLRKRYDHDKIYTATGPILLALNPFKNLASWYSSKVRQKYVKRGEQRAMTVAADDPSNEHDEELPPHVYGLADDAFRSMMKQFEAHHGTTTSSSRTDLSFGQSILVSGESGAGKTVTTKFILQYLASLSERSSGRGSLSKKGSSSKSVLSNSDSATGTTSTIEQQVLQSNPILESFGNARTIRNDNSSRFGKFIEMTFHSSGILCGASIETYLLEKVRLVHQMPGERNYHIFYEILVGLEEDEIDKYYLTDKTPEDFRLTNSSGTYDRRDGVDDYDTFTDLRKGKIKFDFFIFYLMKSMVVKTKSVSKMDLMFFYF
jgi:myosin heavy subunit